MSVIATAYMPFVYQPTKVLCFTKKQDQISMDIVASGIALTPDPLKIILKRVILTGYPLRVHKKKATVRYMFFDPKDIKYFRPVELYTKNGLRVSKDTIKLTFVLGPHQGQSGHARPGEVHV